MDRHIGREHRATGSSWTISAHCVFVYSRADTIYHCLMNSVCHWIRRWKSDDRATRGDFHWQYYVVAFSFFDWRLSDVRDKSERRREERETLGTSLLCSICSNRIFVRRFNSCWRRIQLHRKRTESSQGSAETTSKQKDHFHMSRRKEAKEREHPFRNRIVLLVANELKWTRQRR